MQNSVDPQPAAPPFAGQGWRLRRLRPVATPLVQVLDLVILSLSSLAVALLPSMRRMHGSYTSLLQLRVSLRVALVAVLCVFTWRVILASIGLYTPQRMRSMRDYLLRCLIGLNSCALVVGLILTVLHSPENVWRVVAVLWLASLAGTAALRLALLLRAGEGRPSVRRQRTLIVVGSGKRAHQAWTELESTAEWEYRLLGFVDSQPQGGFVPVSMILGGIDDLERILTKISVDEVMIALPMKSQYEAVGYTIAVCQMLGVRSHYFTESFPAIGAADGGASSPPARPPGTRKLVQFKVERNMDEDEPSG